MAPPPLMSFIILVHNYRDYVVEALRSALAQSVQDFEIVVVDDGSSDDSAEIVASFTDRRIRLLRNQKNMGGAWSYNRAIGEARGEFLVNLDADDWLDPLKCERQLEAFRRDPGLDIIGSYIRSIDRNGQPSEDAAQREGYCNRPRDLNLVASWVVQNPLCRSSTMMRRSSHLRIGLDDVTMTYACDFELWMRALRKGCRFAIVPEKLCSYRWHGGNVTFKDPPILYLEIAYIFARNVMPIIEQKALYATMPHVVSWFSDHEQFAKLSPRARYRVIASLFGRAPVSDFASYREAILSPAPDPERETLGRRIFALFKCSPDHIAGLAYEFDTKRLTASVDYYRKSCEEWELRCKALEAAAHPSATDAIGLPQPSANAVARFLGRSGGVPRPSRGRQAP